MDWKKGCARRHQKPRDAPCSRFGRTEAWRRYWKKRSGNQGPRVSRARLPRGVAASKCGRSDALSMPCLGGIPAPWTPSTGRLCVGTIHAASVHERSYASPTFLYGPLNSRGLAPTDHTKLRDMYVVLYTERMLLRRTNTEREMLHKTAPKPNQ